MVPPVEEMVYPVIAVLTVFVSADALNVKAGAASAGADDDGEGEGVGATGSGGGGGAKVVI